MDAAGEHPEAIGLIELVGVTRTLSGALFNACLFAFLGFLHGLVASFPSPLKNCSVELVLDGLDLGRSSQRRALQISESQEDGQESSRQWMH